jgi:hypothetical protein
MFAGPDRAHAPRGTSLLTFFLLGTAVVVFIGCRDAVAPMEPASSMEHPAVAPSLASAAIPNQYIVVFKQEVPDAPGLARRLVAEHGGALRFSYTAALKGFAAELPQRALDALRHNPNVAYLEQDGTVELFGGGTEPAPPWGLDRVDQRTLPLSTSYTWATSGAGVHVYIIDTGIRTTHEDFGGRATWAFSSVKGKDGTLNTDCHGHGTHVAGTVGGTRYGVAKEVQLYAVRVLDCSGQRCRPRPIPRGTGRWRTVSLRVYWPGWHCIVSKRPEPSRCWSGRSGSGTPSPRSRKRTTGSSGPSCSTSWDATKTPPAGTGRSRIGPRTSWSTWHRPSTGWARSAIARGIIEACWRIIGSSSISGVMASRTSPFLPRQGDGWPSWR